ncbi:MAG: hypothetical protein K0S24_1532 [Sphingobacterium sp.]|jgi:hypothetical protein|nr:hypothetical protein [Sphingobacterium sp.]
MKTLDILYNIEHLERVLDPYSSLKKNYIRKLPYNYSIQLTYLKTLDIL